MTDYVLLFRATPAAQDAAMGTPEAARLSMQKWLAWLRELEAGGHLVHPGQPLAPTGAVVTTAGVSDGPFVEAKDIVLGFLVVQAADLADAGRIARGCPIVIGGGSVEVRPVATGVMP